MLINKAIVSVMKRRNFNYRKIAKFLPKKKNGENQTETTARSFLFNAGDMRTKNIISFLDALDYELVVQERRQSLRSEDQIVITANDVDSMANTLDSNIKNTTSNPKDSDEIMKSILSLSEQIKNLKAKQKELIAELNEMEDD